MSEASVDWRLARRVARLTSQRPPHVTRPEALALVADLSLTAKRAGRLAAEFLSAPGQGAARVAVVDWPGWADAATDLAAALVGPPKRYRRLREFGNGALLGLALGRLGGRLLGQYDGFGGDVVYLVAPSILEHERNLGLPPADFRTWVALHEQAHACQFRLAPWLRESLVTRLRILLDDDANWLAGARDWAETRDLAALLVSREARATMAEVSAAMTFLEGHADFVADVAGAQIIGSVPRLRRAFDRSGPTLLGRLARSLDKSAQYRDGLAFCLAVQRAAGDDALRAAFAAPEALPSAAELADPRSWLRRVSG